MNGNIINSVFTIIGVIIIIGITIRFFKEKHSRKNSIPATITNMQKYTHEVFSKAQAPHTVSKYIITFSTEKKALSFEVSEMSYSQYKMYQKGTLTYKGSKIIDFS